MKSNQALSRNLDSVFYEAEKSGTLNLAGRNLREFPSLALRFDLSDITFADLSRNRFIAIPGDAAGDWLYLEHLDLSHNALRSLEPSYHIQCLQSLTYLDLSNNQLTKLPNAICQLPLEVLLVGQNQLTALPTDLARMANCLTELDVSCNKLTFVPTSIRCLHCLRVFNLRENQLTTLPYESLCQLELEILDLSFNNIEHLSGVIRNVSSILRLSLNHNPLQSPPAKITAKGQVYTYKWLEVDASRREKGGTAADEWSSFGNYYNSIIPALSPAKQQSSASTSKALHQNVTTTDQNGSSNNKNGCVLLQRKHTLGADSGYSSGSVADEKVVVSSSSTSVAEDSSPSLMGGWWSNRSRLSPKKPPIPPPAPPPPTSSVYSDSAMFTKSDSTVTTGFLTVEEDLGIIQRRENNHHHLLRMDNTMASLGTKPDHRIRSFGSILLGGSHPHRNRGATKSFESAAETIEKSTKPGTHPHLVGNERLFRKQMTLDSTASAAPPHPSGGNDKMMVESAKANNNDNNHNNEMTSSADSSSSTTSTLQVPLTPPARRGILSVQNDEAIFAAEDGGRGGGGFFNEVMTALSRQEMDLKTTRGPTEMIEDDGPSQNVCFVEPPRMDGNKIQFPVVDDCIYDTQSIEEDKLGIAPKDSSLKDPSPCVQRPWLKAAAGEPNRKMEKSPLDHGNIAAAESEAAETEADEDFQNQKTSKVGWQSPLFEQNSSFLPIKTNNGSTTTRAVVPLADTNEADILPSSASMDLSLYFSCQTNGSSGTADRQIYEREPGGDIRSQEAAPNCHLGLSGSGRNPEDPGTKNPKIPFGSNPKIPFGSMIEVDTDNEQNKDRNEVEGKTNISPSPSSSSSSESSSSLGSSVDSGIARKVTNITSTTNLSKSPMEPMGQEIQSVKNERTTNNKVQAMICSFEQKSSFSNNLSSSFSATKSNQAIQSSTTQPAVITDNETLFTTASSTTTVQRPNRSYPVVDIGGGKNGPTADSGSFVDDVHQININTSKPSFVQRDFKIIAQSPPSTIIPSMSSNLQSPTQKIIPRMPFKHSYDGHLTLPQTEPPPEDSTKPPPENVPHCPEESESENISKLSTISTAGPAVPPNDDAVAQQDLVEIPFSNKMMSSVCNKEIIDGSKLTKDPSYEKALTLLGVLVFILAVVIAYLLRL